MIRSDFISFITSPGVIHTSVYDSYTQNNDDSGEVLIDDAGIKVSVTNAEGTDIVVRMTVILSRNGQIIGFRRGFGNGLLETIAAGDTVTKEIKDVEFDKHYEYITALKK